MGIRTTTSGPDDSILTLIIANPPVNCLSAEIRESLSAVFESLAGPFCSTRAVVLRGDNHRFSAGADVAELANQSGPRADRELHASFGRLFASVRTCPVPVVAAIEGYAMGGGLELALSCDLRYVVPETRLAASAANMGLVESAHTLAARVPQSFAAELLLTGKTVRGCEAAETGLATGCFDRPDFDAAVAAVVEQIATRAPGSTRAVKEILGVAIIDPVRAATLAKERWLELRAGADHHEALAAFRARRPPHFQGR